MFKRLIPQLYIESILDIPLDNLRQRHIKAFILDLDNTITSWNSNEIRQEVADWFKMLKKKGYKACILSNNGEKRVLSVATSLDIPYIHRAQKPRRKAFKQAVKLMNVTVQETAVIGDQIFTDVLGGNRAGLYTILVTPLDKKEFPGTKISRFFEYWIVKKLKKEHTVDG